jgi:hypothetical protein
MYFHRRLPSEAAFRELACGVRTVNPPPHKKTIGDCPRRALATPSGLRLEVYNAAECTNPISGKQ